MILRDQKNRLFDNFTSLYVSWSSTNYDMASFDVKDTGVEMEYAEDAFSQQGMKSISEYVLTLTRTKTIKTTKVYCRQC